MCTDGLIVGLAPYMAGLLSVISCMLCFPTLPTLNPIALSYSALPHVAVQLPKMPYTKGFQISYSNLPQILTCGPYVSFSKLHICYRPIVLKVPYVVHTDLSKIFNFWQLHSLSDFHIWSPKSSSEFHIYLPPSFRFGQH